MYARRTLCEEGEEAHLWSSGCWNGGWLRLVVVMDRGVVHNSNDAFGASGPFMGEWWLAGGLIFDVAVVQELGLGG